MSIERNEFLRTFGTAVRRRRAAVFVGAGISQGSGFPSWNDLIGPLRDAAQVPATVTDATIAAEYALQELKIDEVERLLLTKLSGVPVQSNDALESLLSIDFAEIWTTNFDTLIETSADEVDLVVDDDDYRRISPNGNRRLTKLHGSLSVGADGTYSWGSRPVITRSDFESFELKHPLKWAMLRAQFLTSSFLFLGFSFADPNVSALLRIVRSLPPEIRRLKHFAVMKAPTDRDEAREFELFCRDLGEAGIEVVRVAEYDDIPELLSGLSRSALPSNLFVSGSAAPDTRASEICSALGAGLATAPLDLHLHSFDGEAARITTETYKEMLSPGQYRAERIVSYFRRSPEDEPSIEVRRFGTAVFTDLDLKDMREIVFNKTKVCVVVGGSDRTLEEMEAPLAKGIPVIPIASAGGAAANLWERGALACNVDVELAGHHWEQLNSTTAAVASQAAVKVATDLLSE